MKCFGFCTRKAQFWKNHKQVIISSYVIVNLFKRNTDTDLNQMFDRSLIFDLFRIDIGL